MKRSMLGIALAATLALAAPAQAELAPQPRVNTFQGECVQIPGSAVFPDGNLTNTPTIHRMIVTLSGGTCSGTLNGKRIDGVPLWSELDVTGLMNCTGPSAGEGRDRFVIDGKWFAGDASYQRVGVMATVLIRGDAGGSVEVLAEAQVPPEQTQATLEQCNQEGLSGMTVMTHRFSAPTGISSPAK